MALIMSFDQSQRTPTFDNRQSRHDRRGVFQTIQRWFELQTLRLQIRRERRQLATLPPHLLDDMGISEARAQRESRLPFTDVPLQRLAMHRRNQYWKIDLD